GRRGGGGGKGGWAGGCGVMKRGGGGGDIRGRYGGEEFVALLYGATRQEAAAFAEAVRETVESTEFTGGPQQPLGRVTISAGVATFPWDAQTDEALIKASDDNLYKAKEGGRNRVVVNLGEPEIPAVGGPGAQ